MAGHVLEISTNVYLLYIRLDEEIQQRMAAEEQLMATQDRLRRYRKTFYVIFTVLVSSHQCCHHSLISSD